MTEQEKLMYELLGKISSTDAPLIFKGGLITRLILQDKGFDDIQRATVDIDANWSGSPPTMDDLVSTINSALGELQDKYVVKPFREYGEKRSAGLNLLDRESGTKIISMDIEIKPPLDSAVYYYGKMGIKGVLPNEILADKICAVSTDTVYKHRAKDLIDLYALSSCVDVNTKDIYEACRDKANNIQSFDGFLNRKPDVEHAYNKLKRIEGKPPFSDIYSYLNSFLKPFIEKDLTEKVWNPQQMSWKKVPEKELELNQKIPQTSKKEFNLAVLKKEIARIHNEPHKPKDPNKSKSKNKHSL